MAVRKLLRNHFILFVIASLFILGLVAFELWDHYVRLPVQDRNRSEIARIRLDPSDFSFAVFGDHKGHDASFEPLLREVNGDKQIAFTIELGDLVRWGRRWFYRRLLDQVDENLSIPYLAVIGNHDLYRGSANYQEIFGPTYYSFRAGQTSFIILDTSTKFLFDKTQRLWLEKELQRSQASKVRFVFMHVPLFDPRGRGKRLSEKDGKDLLDLFKRYHVTHVFACHIHGYFSGSWEEVPYTITAGAGSGFNLAAGARAGFDQEKHFFHHYLKVRVSGDHVTMEVKRINERSSLVNLLSFIKDFGPEWGLFAGVVFSLFTLAYAVKKDFRQSRRPSASSGSLSMLNQTSIHPREKKRI